MNARIIWPQSISPCRLIGIGRDGRRIGQGARVQEELMAKNIDLEIEDGFKGHDHIIVVYWSAHRRFDDPAQVVVFSPGSGSDVAIHACPESELMAYFWRFRELLHQKSRCQEIIGSIRCDEHLIALRHSKESLVRLAGDKVMKKILELGISLGLDWQAELEKLQASFRPKK